MNLLRLGWIGLFWLVSLVLALSTRGDPGRGNVFLSLTYLITILVLVAFVWTRFSLAGVTCQRRLRSGRSEVGKFVEEQVTLYNGGILPKFWLEVRDESELPQHRVSRVVNGLGVEQQHSWLVRTHCFRRGSFRLGPITLRSGDPFGIFARQRRLDPGERLVVYPPTYPLPGFVPAVGELPGGEMHRRRTHHITTNVAGIRDYMPGDGLNRIHWPSTARTGRLFVKEFELDPLSDVWLYLDMDRRWHAGTTQERGPEVELPSVLRLREDRGAFYTLDPSSEEYAVAIAASLARHFLERDWSLGLITYPNLQRRDVAQADRGERQLEHILSLLAVVHAEGNVPLAQVLISDTHHVHRSTTAIVITPCLDRRWVGALAHLTMRGVRPMAILLDSVTFGAVVPDPQAVHALTADLSGGARAHLRGSQRGCGAGCFEPTVHSVRFWQDSHPSALDSRNFCAPDLFHPSAPDQSACPRLGVTGRFFVTGVDAEGQPHGFCPPVMDSWRPGGSGPWPGWEYAVPRGMADRTSVWDWCGTA